MTVLPPALPLVCPPKAAATPKPKLRSTQDVLFAPHHGRTSGKVQVGGRVFARPRRAYFFFFGVCESAEPAAVLESLLVRPSRSTLEAALAALSLVSFPFAMSLTSFRIRSNMEPHEAGQATPKHHPGQQKSSPSAPLAPFRHATSG